MNGDAHLSTTPLSHFCATLDVFHRQYTLSYKQGYSAPANDSIRKISAARKRLRPKTIRRLLFLSPVVASNLLAASQEYTISSHWYHRLRYRRIRPIFQIKACAKPALLLLEAIAKALWHRQNSKQHPASGACARENMHKKTWGYPTGNWRINKSALK